MKATVHGIFLLLFSVLQATWLNAAQVFGVKPNLFLVYIVIVCFFCGKGEGAAIGAVFGLFLDIITGRLLGMNTVLGMMTGFFTAYLCERVFRTSNVLIVMLTAAAFTLLYETAYYAAAFILIIKNADFSYVMQHTILPETLYNAAAALIIFVPAGRAAKFLYADKGEGVGK